MWATRGQLQELGVVGMNDRNINLIARYNPRRLFPLVDNKLKTKLLAQKHDIPTPPLLHTLTTQHDLMDLESVFSGLDGFAIKPAKGSGGKGILVITHRQDQEFVKPSGQHLKLRDMRHHASNILSGLFSLGGSPDIALIEDLIHPDPIYDNLSVEGVPDIRIIVYRGFPIMAMMRLSTRASDGKANLHQGAVGVGLAIRDGCSANAVQFDHVVKVHPDSGADLMAIQIPGWPQLLELAARCADASGLGYLGADLVLDKTRGPLLLELNARPGLAIQIANGVGLSPRVQAIDDLPAASFELPPQERGRIAMSLF